MGIKYLLDTNTVIDFTNGLLPAASVNLIITNQPAISFITRIELFAWSKLTLKEEIVLDKFIKLAIVFGSEEEIILKTIEIKKNNKIKLPDAIIAATALVYGFDFLSRNLSDFINVTGLNVIDPHSI